MHRETYTYAYGFIAGILLTAFVAVTAYAVCDYYCHKMYNEMLEKGTVIIVPSGTTETVP